MICEKLATVTGSMSQRKRGAGRTVILPITYTHRQPKRAVDTLRQLYILDKDFRPTTGILIPTLPSP